MVKIRRFKLRYKVYNTIVSMKKDDRIIDLSSLACMCDQSERWNSLGKNVWFVFARGRDDYRGSY